MTSPLTVEVLESRDVPAAFYWNPLFFNGVERTNVDVASNWTDASGARKTAAPGSADDLYFTGQWMGSGAGNSGPAYPNEDAVIKSASGGQSAVRTYNGVHLMAGYGGTVDFQVSSFVGVLELRNGRIAQNDAFFTTMGGGQLSVTQSMTWTGGAFNSGKIDPSTGVYVPPPAGKLNLLGNTVSVFDPGDNNTVALGSFLTVTNITSLGTGIGAKLDMISGGSINLEGIAGVLAEGGSLCQVKVKAQPAPQPQVQELFICPPEKRLAPEGDFRKITITTGAEFQISRANPQVGGAITHKLGDISMLVDGGAFQVVGGITATMDGKLSNDASAPTLLIRSGGVRIENGSDIYVRSGLRMEGGSIVTLAAMDGPGSVAATQGEVSILGDVTILGGDVMVNYNLGKGGLDNTTAATLETTFSTILITGKLDWSGGKFLGFVNSTTRGRDTISVLGVTCSISKDVTFDLSISNQDSGLSNVPANTTFTIVDSAVAITGTPTLTGSFTKVASLLHSGDDKKIQLKKN